MWNSSSAFGSVCHAELVDACADKTFHVARGWAVERTFTPTMDEATRAARYDGWKDAVARTLSRA